MTSWTTELTDGTVTSGSRTTGSMSTGLLDVDNIQINGNIVSSTDTNGNINLTPNGTGSVVVSPSFQVDNIKIDANTVSSTDTNGNILFIPHGSGNVGIGAASPAALLEVNGGASADGVIRIVGGETNYEARIELFADEGDDNADKFAISADEGNKLRLATYSTGAWVTGLAMDTSGNIGIGTATPDSLFHVKGSATAAMVTIESTATTAENAAPELILYRSGALSDTDSIGAIRFKGVNDNASPQDINYATIYGRIDSEADGSEDGSIIFQTAQEAGVLTNALAVKGANVGIGTTAPTGTLHVVYAGVDDNAPGLLIESTEASANSAPDVRLFRNSASPANLDYIGEISMAGESSTGVLREYCEIYGQAVDVTNGAEYGRLAFRTRVNGTATDTMYVYNGKVGVGTSTPDTTLEVVGSFASNGPSSTFVTMSSGDTSPDVSGGNIFKSHTDGVTIDQFDGGICGQIITIISGGATVYDVTSSELKGGTTNITTAAGDVTMWVCESATVWHLLSWMDLSINLSSGGF